jgi:hypothetical protein
MCQYINIYTSRNIKVNRLQTTKAELSVCELIAATTATGQKIIVKYAIKSFVSKKYENTKLTKTSTRLIVPIIKLVKSILSLVQLSNI